jgi:hypothetical protein
MRKRIGILWSASALAAVATLGFAPGAAGFKAGAIERDWTGATSASAGYQALDFTTQAARKNGKEKLPFKLKGWGFGAPVTCTGAPAPYSEYQNFPGYVGAGGGEGRGPKLKFRNGRFSEHGVYDVVVYGSPKRITYDVTGRFTNPRNATGTLQVSTFWSHPDGTTTSCASGPLTWSACAWNMGSFQAPACAGIDPTI